MFKKELVFHHRTLIDILECDDVCTVMYLWNKRFHFTEWNACTVYHFFFHLEISVFLQNQVYFWIINLFSLDKVMTNILQCSLHPQVSVNLTSWTHTINLLGNKLVTNTIMWVWNKQYCKWHHKVSETNNIVNDTLKWVKQTIL